MHLSHITKYLFILILFFPDSIPAQAAKFIRPSTPLPQPRAFHGTAVMGDYLYVLGGSTLSKSKEGKTVQNVDSSVHSAKISAGSSIGEWTLENWSQNTPLPAPLHYIGNSTLVLNDVVYVIGGGLDPLSRTVSNVAYWSKPLNDGRLTPWQKSRPFGEGLSTVTAVSTPGHIYIIGGYAKTDDSENVSNKVYYNQIFTDGTMGNWAEGNPIPYPLWYHCAGVAANRAYVWGGLVDSAPDMDKVSVLSFSAPVLGNGRLGNWRREPQMLSRGIYSAEASVAGPYLLGFSPRYGRANSDELAPTSGDVWWTYITPSGMYDWIREPTPITNRVYHSVATDYRRGTIWITGGKASRSEQMHGNVAYFTLSPEARQLAENQWSNALQAHASTVATFQTLSTKQSSGDQGADKLSFLADRRLTADAVEGFMTIDNARRNSNRPGNEKPMVMYYNIESAEPCKQQKVILESPEFAGLTQKASFAWINTREYPQLAQQTGVYRIPTWVFFDKEGNEINRLAKVMELSEIDSILSQIQ